MIVNRLNDKEIKILIDEVDLNKAKILLLDLISKPDNVISYIKALLKNDKLIINNYSIYTYNYKVFLIIISI